MNEYLIGIIWQKVSVKKGITKQKQLTKTLAKRFSNSPWSGIGNAARFRTLACRTWWFCKLLLFCKLFDDLDEFRLMVAIGVTLVMAVLAKSPLSFCVGDAGVCAAVSCDDDVIPIFCDLMFITTRLLL